MALDLTSIAIIELFFSHTNTKIKKLTFKEDKNSFKGQFYIIKGKNLYLKISSSVNLPNFRYV